MKCIMCSDSIPIQEAFVTSLGAMCMNCMLKDLKRRAITAIQNDSLVDARAMIQKAIDISFKKNMMKTHTARLMGETK